MSYPLLKPLLFSLEPELAHSLTLNLLKWRHRLLGFGMQQALVKKPISLMGLNFPNNVGLAAGLDKNGDYIDALGSLGFGFIEVGTVTPKPQLGNPKPRLFRIPEKQAIINRMGFNNKGVDYCVEKLKARRYKGIVGVNIGKNRDTSLENAVDDYLYGLTRVYPYADYIVVNISSPNTPDLRTLQFGKALNELLTTLKAKQIELSKATRYVPLLIKCAPDLAEEDIASLANTCLDCQIDGIIATNTTIEYTAVANFPYGNEQGGLSGPPLTDLSTTVIKHLHTHLKGKIPIIAVGGIMSAKDAAEKLAVGADLIQLYTGLIYQGPELIRECLG